MSILCKGITTKNKNCKQKVNNLSGYCRFHIDQYEEKKVINENNEDDQEENDQREEKKVIRESEESNNKKSNDKKESKELNDKKITLKELKKDKELNELNWNKLFKQISKDKIDNMDKINKYRLQLQSLLINFSHIKTARINTQFLIERDPIQFSGLLDIMENFDIHTETLEIEKKDIIMNLDILNKTNISITKFCNYYLSKNKNHLPSKPSKNHLLSFRLKTTDKYECVICCQEDTKGLVLDCGHKFHIECISKWFYNTLNCPMCKTKLV